VLGCGRYQARQIGLSALAADDFGAHDGAS
jgi:hypothetical protein